MTGESEAIHDPFAGCFDYVPAVPLTAPGTEYGFLEYHKPRKGNGTYLHYQCKFRKVVNGAYVYCRFHPRNDHFGTGHHKHRFAIPQPRIDSIFSRETDSPQEQSDGIQSILRSPCRKIYEAIAVFAARANIALEKAEIANDIAYES